MVNSMLQNIEKASGGKGSLITFLVVKDFHLIFLLGAIMLVAGFLITVRKTLGWSLGISMCVYQIYVSGMLLYRSLFFSDETTTAEAANQNLMPVALGVSLMLLFLFSFVYFLLPKVRSDFKIGKLQYAIALGLTGLIFFDRFLI